MGLCCAQAFPSCGVRASAVGTQGLLVAMLELLSYVPVSSCCGAWALEHTGSAVSAVAAHWLL